MTIHGESATAALVCIAAALSRPRWRRSTSPQIWPDPTAVTGGWRHGVTVPPPLRVPGSVPSGQQSHRAAFVVSFPIQLQRDGGVSPLTAAKWIWLWCGGGDSTVVV
ncbi:hypothetical protein E2562_010854 [Oryza meyeriana var. granulata]|uniref:Uncharacterized protein n=1 Tax=Oryza meyeriana var. granulata TaxID=110450 RepID=A0A6G1BL63_9ORYZ|nr:hypothetical protein E2562_010854 [Oryza meyeriana var. granulata]